MKISLLCVFSFIYIFNIYAQEYTISGRALDSARRTPLIGANVLLVNQKDQSKTGVNTNNEGKFLLAKVYPNQYIIKISYVGYRPFERKIIIKDKDIDLKNIILVPDSIVLNEVITEGEAPLMEQKGDTTQYHASAYKVSEDATSEDLVKRMPGITIDNRTGKVESQGEHVKKVLIDKKPFLGNDARAALKNLPAKLVKKVQVYDEKSDQAMFTGVPDGQKIKVINLETKFVGGIKDAQFNKFSAGYGTDDRYILSGHYTKFSDNGRVSVYGQMNNINNGGFTFENDKVSTIFGYRNTRNMDSKVQSLGAGYTNSYSGDFQFTGNYSLNSGKSEILRKVGRDYNEINGLSQFYAEDQNSEAKTLYHKIDFNLKYAYDSVTNIAFTPNISYQTNDVNSFFSADNYINDKISGELRNNSINEKKIKNVSGNLLINRLLSVNGNSLSFNIRLNYNNNDGTEDRNSLKKIYNDIPLESKSINRVNSGVESNIFFSNLLFTQPLNDNSRMQLGYYITYNKNNSDKRDYEEIPGGSFLDSAQSNIFENRYWTQKAGGKYYYSNASMDLNLGLYYNINRQNKDQNLPYIFYNSRTYKNILPEASLKFKSDRRTLFEIAYSAMPLIPSGEQLQNYIDRSNSLLISTGNPDLKESISHSAAIDLYYGIGDIIKDSYLRIAAGLIKDYIGSNSVFALNDTSVLDNILLSKGSRFTYPVNMKNQLSINSTFRVMIPITFFYISLRMYHNYLESPASINNIISYSLTRKTGSMISFGLTDGIQNTFLGLFNDFKYINSSNSSSRVNKYYDLYSNFNGEYRFPDNFILQADLSYQYYSGMYSNENSNDILVNMSLSKKFLKEKQLEIKLMVYDLFNKSKPIQKRVTDLYIEDTYTKAPKRCIMLTVTYDLKKFQGNI